MTAAAILAAMLQLATPGATLMSRVPLADCGSLPPWRGGPVVAPGCPQERACTGPALVCGPPRWEAARGRWWRAETRSEGLRRWWVIAQALEAESSSREEALAGVVIARNESAFWGLVHSGELRGPLGEVCLMQLHGGLDREQQAAVVGTDLASTRACVAEGLRRFRLARGACRQHRRWFRAAVSRYGRGYGCHPWRLPESARGCDSECRERQFNRLLNAPQPLAPADALEVGAP